MNVLQYISATAYTAVVEVPFGVCEAAFTAGSATVGVAASTLSILTAGASCRLNALANRAAKASLILPYLYIPVLKVVNPYARIDCDSRGIVGAHSTGSIFRHAAQAACQRDFLSQHVISRGGYALGATTAVISRVADLAIGLVAAIFAIIPCLGRIESVNNFAVAHLMVFGAVGDVCHALRGVVNPQQFVYKFSML